MKKELSQTHKSQVGFVSLSPSLSCPHPLALPSPCKFPLPQGDGNAPAVTVRCILSFLFSCLTATHLHEPPPSSLSMTTMMMHHYPPPLHSNVTTPHPTPPPPP